MDHRLELALRLLNTGQAGQARLLLQALLNENRNNIDAWQLYAQTWPAPSDQLRVMQLCLKFNPSDDGVKRAIVALMARKRGSGEHRQAPVRQALAPQDAPGPKPAQRSSPIPWLVAAGSAAVLLAMLAAVFAILSLLPKDPADYRHTQPVDYYLYVPSAYSQKQEWPLFVGIHGAGGSGLDCWNLWQRYADAEGFILLCPSIPGQPDGFYQHVGENTVWSAVAQVRQQYRTSPRMFLSGFSAGAFFVQGFIYHYPQSASGVSILSAGNYIPLGSNLQNIPMLVVIGDRDNALSVQSSREFADTLNGRGFNIQYELLPGVGHRVTSQGRQLTIELFRKAAGQ